jgi:hypothetical protein
MAQKAMDIIALNISTKDGYGVAGMNSWESAYLLSGVAMAEYTTGARHLQVSLQSTLEQVAGGIGHGDPNA